MTRYGLLIDYAWCTGCHSCEAACKQEHGLPIGHWGIRIMENGPWKIEGDVWQYDYVPLTTNLCDLCEERVGMGKLPSCVQHCQAACMSYGPIDELAKEMVDKKRAVLIAPETN